VTRITLNFAAITKAATQKRRASRVWGRETPGVSAESHLGRNGVVGLPTAKQTFIPLYETQRARKSFGDGPSYFFNAARRQPFNSALSSLISMPCITMNLQDRSSRGLFSSGNLQVTRQYWQS